MKITSIEPQTDYSEIKSGGMINTFGGWIEIQTTVLPYRETEKAYYALIRVDEIIDGEFELFYRSSKTSWIPKSMVDNVWWICKNKFDETRKVSNRVFTKKENYSKDSDYDPYKTQQEEEMNL